MKMIDVQHDRVHGVICVMNVELGGVAIEELLVVEPGQMIALRQAQGVPVLGQLDGAQHPGKHDFLLRVRFGNEIDGAQRQTLYLRFSVGGHNDDRYTGGSGIRLDLPKNIQPAEIRQIQIQQNQAERLILGMDDAERFRSLFNHNKVVAVLQEQFQDLLVDILILD